MCWNPKDDDYDRIHYNPDGQKFYGFDDDDNGTTDWYTEDGCLDSVTETPIDFEEYDYDYPIDFEDCDFDYD